jgi:hypothetical protein
MRDSGSSGPKFERVVLAGPGCTLAVTAPKRTLRLALALGVAACLFLAGLVWAESRTQSAPGDRGRPRANDRFSTHGLSHGAAAVVEGLIPTGDELIQSWVHRGAARIEGVERADREVRNSAGVDDNGDELTDMVDEDALSRLKRITRDASAALNPLPNRPLHEAGDELAEPLGAVLSSTRQASWVDDCVPFIRALNASEARADHVGPVEYVVSIPLMNTSVTLKVHSSSSLHHPRRNAAQARLYVAVAFSSRICATWIACLLIFFAERDHMTLLVSDVRVGLVHKGMPSRLLRVCCSPTRWCYRLHAIDRFRINVSSTIAQGAGAIVSAAMAAIAVGRPFRAAVGDTFGKACVPHFRKPFPYAQLAMVHCKPDTETQLGYSILFVDSFLTRQLASLVPCLRGLVRWLACFQIRENKPVQLASAP